MTQLKNLFRHIAEMPFVSAVAVGALIHSSWSLSTYFTGHEPPQFTWQWLAWIVPGALIGFAIDIGIVSVAFELKHGARQRSKFAAFFVLSATMYLLQTLYLLAHTPFVPLAEGVSVNWTPIATAIRDAAIWLVPLMLPGACLLYTFSAGGSTATKAAPSPVAHSASPTETQEAPAIAETPLSVSPNGHGKRATANIADES